MIDLDVVNLSLGVIAISSVFAAYKLGFKKGRTLGLFIRSSNNIYNPYSYCFASKTVDETISKLEVLLKRDDTFLVYYGMIKFILNGLISQQSTENKLDTITPKYIYDVYLFPNMKKSEKLQFNFCLDCIKKEKIYLVKDFTKVDSVFEDSINNNLLDTGRCSCCGKTNDVLNPFIYTVLTELNLDSYFGKIDSNNNDKCPRIWYENDNEIE